jgi:hypothetical protein
MHATVHHGGVEVVRARHHVRHDLRLGRVRHRWFQDADNGGRAIAEANGLSNDRLVGLQHAGPEPVRQHHGALGGRSVIGRPDQPACDGPQSHHAEVRPAHDPGPHHARLAKAHQREFQCREIAKGRHALHAGLQVAQLGNREVRVLDIDARRTLPDVDQAVFVLIGEGAQEHALDHGEDGGVGADAERQGQHDGEGESPGLCQGTRGVTEIIEHGHSSGILLHGSGGKAACASASG